MESHRRIRFFCEVSIDFRLSRNHVGDLHIFVVIWQLINRRTAKRLGKHFSRLIKITRRDWDGKGERKNDSEKLRYC